MGGRGSRFKDVGQIKREEDKYYTDYGDANLDFETGNHNKLTNSLKNSNIIVCKSIENLKKEIADENLGYIKELAETYDDTISDNLNDEKIKIRSYKMNYVNKKTLAVHSNTSVLALFAPGQKQICLNERVFKTKEKLIETMKSSQKSGHSVKTDKGKEMQAVITHEFGHFIENCIIEKRIQNDVREWAQYKSAPIQEAESTRKNIAKDIKDEIKEIAKQKYKAKKNQLTTSKYGEFNDDPFEWFAEVFTESRLHTTKKPLIKAMKSFLKGEK